MQQHDLGVWQRSPVLDVAGNRLEHMVAVKKAAFLRIAKFPNTKDIFHPFGIGGKFRETRPRPTNIIYEKRAEIAVAFGNRRDIGHPGATAIDHLLTPSGKQLAAINNDFTVGTGRRREGCKAVKRTELDRAGDGVNSGREQNSGRAVQRARRATKTKSVTRAGERFPWASCLSDFSGDEPSRLSSPFGET